MEPEPRAFDLPLIASRQEAGNVRTFMFETGGLTWVAGQSQAYVLPQAGPTSEENERWFTIASAPTEGTINISTRVSGSRFKQALNALEPGQTIRAHSLEGDFTWEDDAGPPVVLVAGGIGVTPFRSILIERQVRGKPLNATLLYFNRTDEIPFRDELDGLARRHPAFTLQVVVGRPVTVERILEIAPEAHGRGVYLSGAEPMVETVGSALLERGIAVKQDWFPGYDERTY